MKEYFAKCLCVLLLTNCGLTKADVYIDTSGDEIKISNVTNLEHYDIRITELEKTSSPQPSNSINTLPYHEYVAIAAQKFAIEPALLHAVIAVESNHNPRAKSQKGAYGLMQLMPKTSKYLSVKNKQDPKQNIMAGARYLRELMNTFNDDMQLTLAAYNAGPATVIKYGRKIPPYKETQAYIQKVMQFYQQHS